MRPRSFRSPEGRVGMTNTITTEVDEGHPIDAADTELTSANSAAQHIAQTCLTDGPVGRVGLEIEAHCFDLADPARRPEWDELSAIIADIGALPGGSLITVEPGGAVELSGPPIDGVLPAITAHGGRPGGAALGVRRGRSRSGPARCRPAAARQAGQPRRPLPRHGAVLRGQPDRRCGGGDDDVDGVGAGEPRGRAAGGLGGAGPARPRARSDDGRDRRQLAPARREVHRLAQLAAVGVEPARLRAVWSDPRGQR